MAPVAVYVQEDVRHLAKVAVKEPVLLSVMVHVSVPVRVHVRADVGGIAVTLVNHLITTPINDSLGTISVLMDTWGHLNP